MMYLSEIAKREAIQAITKELWFLEDNVYRYRLDDAGSGKHAETIRDHDRSISALKEAKRFLEES